MGMSLLIELICQSKRKNVERILCKNETLTDKLKGHDI